MNARESMREAENLRFRFQMNNRLRLECLAAVSKVFREFGEPIADELLASVVFALPQELISSNGRGFAPVEQLAADDIAQSEQKPGNPPDKPKPDQAPGNPPDQPKPGGPPDKSKPGNPPAQPSQPALPPEEPEALPLQAPGIPPESPEQVATGYLA
jgi:hypothetical protein